MAVSADRRILSEGLNDPSPFTKVLALDWYDGPTGGVVQLGEGGEVFRFELLDKQQLAETDIDLRVFGLYPLLPNALARLTAALTPTHEPNWPVWFPIWEFPTDEARSKVDQEADDILAQAGPLTWVVI